MLLREPDFIEHEGGAPLLMQNHKYLHKHADIAWNKTRSWPELLGLDLTDHRPLSSTLEEEKKSFRAETDDAKSPQKANYGLKLMKQPNRIIRKDADRTFLTEPKRQLLITVLESLKTAFNDYQQTMSYVSGVLLLFFEPKLVFEMMFVLGRHPHYNMSGYWRSEAVSQGVDAFVVYEMLKKLNPKLASHLSACGVLPDTFIQKWFGGLAVQVMPTEHLLTFWTQYFKHGFRYLFKFVMSLLQTLTPLLLSIDVDYRLYEVLRVERKSQFWRVCKGCERDSPRTIDEKVGVFFTEVLSGANSVGGLFNMDNVDFQKEREYAFDVHLKGRFLNAARKVTLQGFCEEEDDEDDGFKDCEFCEDGFAEVFCTVCEKYLCDDCKEKEEGEHAVTHLMKELDDMLNIE